MPVTIGSTTIGSQAITGNPPARPAGRFQLIPRYKIRVLDPLSGAVLIDALPHPHQASFEVIFPQAGMSGMSSVGQTTVPLFNPMTDEYAWAKVYYDKLDHLQRLEFYPIDDDGVGVSGDPAHTAVITELPKGLTDYAIRGLDSMYLAQLARTLRADTFNDRSDVLFRYALKGYQMNFGSDLTSLSPFTNDGGWTLVTDQGFSGVKAGPSGDGLLYTTASYANSKYADMMVEAPFHCTVEQASGKVASAEVVAALSDTNNFVMGRAQVTYLAANSRLAVTAEIWQKVGGSYGTVKASTRTEISVISVDAQLTITLVGFQNGSSMYGWRVLVNQTDTGTAWFQGVATGSPSGSIGLRSSIGGAQANEVVVAQHHLVFLSKQAIFQPGNVGASSQVVTQPIPQQPMIDLLQLAALSEGWNYRKNPKAGINNDTVDFNASVGGDLSGMVRFEEGPGNTIVSGGNEANAEQFNTALIGAGSPGYDGEGQQPWYDIAAINKYGLITDVVSLSQVTDGHSLRKAADAVLKNRKTPSQAKRFVVVRDERHAELPGLNKPTGLSYREGDWVELHVPRLGYYHLRAQIVSVKIQEGSPTMELTFDQYPRLTDRDPWMDRLIKTVSDLQLRSSEPSRAAQVVVAGQTFTTGGTRYNRQAVLPLNPWKMRVYQAGAQNVSKDVVTKVLFDTVTTDTSNAFSATNSNYVAPIAGFYVIDAAVSFAQPSESNQWQYWIAFIYVNSLLAKQGTTTEFLEPGIAVSVAQCSATVSDNCYYLNAGDVVDIRFVVHVAAATVAIATGSPYTAWSMHLVSG